MIRSRDATAHFNEIVRVPTRFFVKISAACPIAGHAPPSRAPTIIEEQRRAATQAFNKESFVSVCLRLWKSTRGARMSKPREPCSKAAVKRSATRFADARASTAGTRRRPCLSGV
ncbi:hypothetical protein [Burkholderia plantarii]|uniref:hypothetical protein n=1 Tax=Burkholderia plantarii TaxID=41899 RepID=UPI0018DAFB92|nr:hypothetical protein [Burkholderia plantarii]MBI0328134.1 hypothetical protein [Burkholderia plantarii]